MQRLVSQLIDRGVVIHAPQAVVIQDIDPQRIEAGVEIFPGTTLRGRHTLLGAGTCLGRCGGGYFDNIATGRRVELYGGFFQDAVFLDDVIIRGHAEIRGGTLIEEGGEAGHHVGYKMTILMPYVIAGSLINFCDALVAGGTGRRDHTEIGSTLALYNFTPWGDKFASLFGDVPGGLFLRARRIFIGGQSQIVSPVKVGFGSVIPAGYALRRSVGPDRIYGELPQAIDAPFAQDRLGALAHKIALSAEFIGNLYVLRAWYQEVRLPMATHDPHLRALYQRATTMLDLGIAERRKRLATFMARVPNSLEAHHANPGPKPELTHKRLAEHRWALDLWPALDRRLAQAPDLAAVFTTVSQHMQADAKATTYLDALRALPQEVVDHTSAACAHVVAAYLP